MLPDRVNNGSALSSATARALGASHGPSDPEDSDSSDGMASDDTDASSLDNAATARPSDDDQLGQVATELPARAGYTAVATAAQVGTHATTSEAVSTAAIVYGVISVPLTCDDRLGWQASPLPDRAGCGALMPSGDEQSVTACLEHYDDENKRSEDACSQSSSQDVPMPAVGQQGPVLSVYADNVPTFTRTLCAYTACDLAALSRHRRTAHRGTCFVDHFHSGCTCGIGHRSRAAVTKHALTCLASPSYTAAVARDSGIPASTSPPLQTRSVWHALRPEEDPTPYGPLSAEMAAATAVASSRTVPADVAHPQSAVPAAITAAGHQHVPPMWCPSLSQSDVRVAGKHRRLDDLAAVFPDLDDLMADASVEPCYGQVQDEDVADMDAVVAPASTRRPTRWGPRHRAVGAAAITPPTTGARATPAPAVRRPLTPAASGTRATRWGPRHGAIGGAAVAHLVTGEPTVPAPAVRPPLPAAPRRAMTRLGPRVAVTVPIKGRRTCLRRTSSIADRAPAAATSPVPTDPPPSPAPSPASPCPSVDVAAGEAESKPWLMRFDGACRQNPGPGGACAALFDSSGTVGWTCSHFLPASTETNNTAGYTALLVGVQSAVHHGAT
uniref:RNase H type-1 domain-containing protein n=1 Tax=Peronospora matthiolae TaxID=2874970 RepID=A0AAV1T5L7_9STRA